MVRKKVIPDTDISLYVSEYRRLRKIDISDFKWVLDNLVKFVKKSEIKLLIEKSVEKFLPREEFTEIEQEMARISAISTTFESDVYDYFGRDSIVERAARRERERIEEEAGRCMGITTGIPAMDKTLAHGGWYPKELYLISAPPKLGKTMALLWFANIAAYAGFNVAYYSLEVSKEVLGDRLDASNALVESKLLKSKSFYVAKKIDAKIPKGKLMLFEYPTKSCTVKMIERQLRKIEVERGIVTNFLVVDYGDIMRPGRTYNDKLAEQATIFEDLRGLAGKFGIPVLTATQINRSGSGKSLTTGSDVSGTFEKIMVADCNITLSATTEERKTGLVRIHFAESRNNESTTFQIKTKYNFGRFFDEFVGAE
jgi:replicative DNA helicase